RGAQPLRRHPGAAAERALAAALTALALAAAERPRRLSLALGDRRGRNGDRFVLEAAVLRSHLRLRGHVEHEHLLLRDVLFARHRVAVGLERRPRIRQRVDDPQVLHLAFVAPDEYEPFRVVRPDDVDGRDARVLVGRRRVLLRLVLLILLLQLLLLLLLLLL